MTRSQTVLVALIALLVVGGLVVLARGASRRAEKLALLAALLLAPAATFLAGGWFQFTTGWFGRWRDRPAAEAFGAFTASGDPSLARRVAAARPATPPAPLDDAAAFARWQAATRARLATSTFAVPGDTMRESVLRELRVETLDDGVRRRFVTFAGFDGTPLPAYLLEPRDGGGGTRRAGIVVVAGHGNGIVETAGLAPSYQHAVGLELARAGYVVLCPELRGFGYLGARIGNEHRITAANAVSAGTFYTAVISADLGAAVRAVRALPSVDSLRVGLTGVSLGGELALLHAALDARVAAVVVQGYVPRVGARNGSAVDSGGDAAAEHFGQLVPGVNTLMRAEDLALLVVPRPMLVVTGAKDALVAAPSEALLAMLRGAYRLHGREANFGVAVEPGGHEYFIGPAVRFFAAHL